MIRRLITTAMAVSSTAVLVYLGGLALAPAPEAPPRPTYVELRP